MQLAVATEIILQLDIAMEYRQLSIEERLLCKLLKLHSLGLAAIQKMRWKQRLCLSWLQLGDANNKFFHLRANVRCRKNFILSLFTAQGTKTTHEEKE